jgi:flagellar basal body-associated protein FliL
MAGDQKKNSSLISTVLILLLGLAGGAVAMAFLHPPATSKVSEPPNKVRAVLHLETFTVDMSSPEQKVYLRVGIDLGLGHDLKGLPEDGGTPTALIRDTILGILMALKPDDLTSIDGKQKLKDRILEALRQRAPELAAQEVYFTEFLMQR